MSVSKYVHVEVKIHAMTYRMLSDDHKYIHRQWKLKAQCRWTNDSVAYTHGSIIRNRDK